MSESSSPSTGPGDAAQAPQALALAGIAAHRGAEEPLASWRDHPDEIVSADFADSERHDEQRMPIDRFGLHPHAIHDAQRGRHQPKNEAFPDGVFILLKGIGPETPEFGKRPRF